MSLECLRHNPDVVYSTDTFRYTMQGDLELTNLSAPKMEAGIVPRVLHRLFSLLHAAENTEFSVKCSYVELYNEELRDLLVSDNAPVNNQQPGGLRLYEDGKKGVLIQGLEECAARSLKEALSIVNKGVQKRQVAETKMNTESSYVADTRVIVSDRLLMNRLDDHTQSLPSRSTSRKRPLLAGKI